MRHRISGAPALFRSCADLDGVVALGAILGFCWAAQAVLITVFVSLLIALALAPLVALLARVRIPRPVGSFMAVLLLSVSLYGLGRLTYREAAAFAHKLPEVASEVQGVVGRFRSGVGSVTQLENAVRAPADGRNQPVEVRMETNWGGILARGAASLSELLLSLAFVPFLVYFMLTWQDHIEQGIVGLFPPTARPQTKAALGDMGKVMRTFLVGNLWLALGTSIVTVPVFALLHIADAPLVGVLSGFLSVVPYFGVILAVLPPVIAGLDQLTGSVFLGIVGTVLGLHLIALNVAYPKLIGERVSLNPLVVTLALLFMGWLWGAPGLLLAIPIAGMLKIVFDTVDSLHPLGFLMGTSKDLHENAPEAAT